MENRKLDIITKVVLFVVTLASLVSCNVPSPQDDFPRKDQENIEKYGSLPLKVLDVRALTQGTNAGTSWIYILEKRDGERTSVTVFEHYNILVGDTVLVGIENDYPYYPTLTLLDQKK